MQSCEVFQFATQHGTNLPPVNCLSGVLVSKVILQLEKKPQLQAAELGCNATISGRAGQ